MNVKFSKKFSKIFIIYCPKMGFLLVFEIVSSCSYWLGTWIEIKLMSNWVRNSIKNFIIYFPKMGIIIIIIIIIFGFWSCKYLFILIGYYNWVFFGKKLKEKFTIQLFYLST